MKIVKKICLIVALVISMIYHGMIAHNMAEKFFCGQMLKAIENDDMQRLKVALFFGDPNSSLGIPLLDVLSERTDRRTPLQAACEKGDFEMVKVLVENGADVNYTSWNASDPALNYAVENDTPENLEIVRYLIENDADVNPSKYSVRSPLFWLLSDKELPQNGMEILRELVNAGANVEDSYQAFYWGNNEVIQYLIEECGLEVSDYLYMYLYCRGFGGYSYEIFELMMQHGASPYAKNKDGVCGMDHLKKVSPEWAETVAEMAKEYGFEG